MWRLREGGEVLCGVALDIVTELLIGEILAFGIFPPFSATTLALKSSQVSVMIQQLRLYIEVQQAARLGLAWIECTR